MAASYPKAIVHFDGDAFFASVLQMMDHTLRGKPVITGGERGSATSLSYEAKALGLHRGMPMQEIRRIAPEAIIVPSDYTAYSIYARRMYAIVREFTPKVEEYSIDECFADITGLEDAFGMTYAEIVLCIKQKLEQSLGVTFGVGLASSKTLAKVASKYHKPAGLTLIPTERIEEILGQTAIYDVWGLGGVGGTKLNSLGVPTALDFIRKDDGWLKDNGFVKPQRDTWLELKGYYINPVRVGKHGEIGSVMKTRTFSPPSMERSFIFSQLSKNVEAACVKLRRAGLKARALSFYLKTQEFTYHAVQMDLPVALSTASEMLECIEKRFDEVYATEILYRATGVTLRALVTDSALTPDLFGEFEKRVQKNGSFDALDRLNKKYGNSTVFLASSLQALRAPELPRARKRRKGFLRQDLEHKKSLDIPFLGIAR
ncbi:MAG: DNA polymerase IV [Parcubacteria bacterium C7867-004]|nr:MAG: DNA polymerase IV [Parcubacteria bacterium C7867-004]